MTVETFFANFGHLADAPNGVQKLRELILQLAVQGKLVPQDPSDEPASVLLEKIAAEKEKLIKKGRIKKGRKLSELDGEPYALPIGWQWARLNDVYDVRDGTHDTPKYVSKGFPLVTSKNLSSGKLDLSDVKFISEEDHSKIQDRSRVDKLDILFAMIGSIGNPVIVDTDIDFSIKNVALFKFYSLDLSEPSYLCKYLVNVSNEMKKKAAGGVQSFVSLGFLRGYPFPLPPLEEQKRIVAKVDQLMALCDELEARQQKKQQGRVRLNNAALDALLTAREPDEFTDRWQRICTNFDLLYDHPETISKLRAAILQLAVQGKLVPQDPNDEPASVLLERLKAEKERLVKEGKIKKQKKLPAIKDEEKPFELPVGWEWTRVWNVAEMITSGSRGWAKYYSDKGPIFVTMGNLSRGHYKLRMKTIRYVNPPNTGEGSRTRLVENDLLISITGDVGNLGLIPKGFGEAYINQHTCLLRFMPECQSRYFPEVMRSPLANLQYGAPQRGIKNSFRLGDVGEMIIPVPPLEEQKRIVTKVDQLMSLCDKLEAKLNQAHQHSENLMEATVQQLLVV